LGRSCSQEIISSEDVSSVVGHYTGVRAGQKGRKEQRDRRKPFRRALSSVGGAPADPVCWVREEGQGRDEIWPFCQTIPYKKLWEDLRG
jgi:hypothetical protein